MLNPTKLLAAAVLALGVAVIAPAPIALANGMAAHTMWHSTHLVGTPVFNDQHQQIGTITDVLVSPSGTTTEAVLSVGSFVGGTKLVAVPLAHLTAAQGSMTMHGATKAALDAMTLYVGGSG